MAHTAISEEKYMKETEDPPVLLDIKITKLAEMIRSSKHFIVFTGAGVSTSAGIPDFRGPEGVWTLAAQGRQSSKKATLTVNAYPTVTHMSLVGLQNAGVMKYLVSQNCDGLHKRSGIHHDKLSELHGNSNIEKCEACEREYLRDYACHRLGHGHDHYTGRHCVAPVKGRVCNGRLLEHTVDFGQSLPVKPLEVAFANAQQADLCLVLGSSLSVSPACDLPALVKKQRGRLVICNLQLTKLSADADLHIHAPCDKVMGEVMAKLRACSIPAEIPRWVLRRYVVMQVQSTDQGLQLRVGGRDPDDHSLSATIFQEVEIEYNSKKMILLKEPFEVVMNESPRNAPLEVKLKFHWMGHYDEPAVSISAVVAPSGRPQQWEWRMCYTASLGTWDVIPVQLAANLEGESKTDLFREQDHTFPEFQLTVQPCVSEAIEGGKPHPPCLWAASALLNEKLFVFGGAIDDFDSTDSRAKFMSSFDPLLNLWVANPTVEASLAAPCVKFPRWGLTATSNADASIIYLFGGFDHASQFADLYAFTPYIPSASISPSSADSSSLSPSLSPVAALSPSSISRSAPTHSLTLLQLFHSPSPRAGHSTTFISSFGASNSPHLLTFGGCFCKDGVYVFNNELHVLNLEDGKEWQEVNYTGAAPSARAQHSAVLVGSCLLVIGGCNENWLFNDVYTFNLKTSHWNKMTVDHRIQLSHKVPSISLPPLVALTPQEFRLWPSMAPACVLWLGPSFSTAAVFVSGLGAAPEFCDTHNNQYVLFVDAVANIGQLTPARFSAAPLLARSAHCVAVVGKRILVFGGRNHQLRSTEGGMVSVAVASE